MNEKNKAISLVGLVLLTFSLVFLYQGISYSNKALQQSIDIAEGNMDSNLLSIQNFSFAPYEARIENLLDSHPEIIEAVRKQDRRLLYELAVPPYKALQKENKFFHVMHFHLPNSTTLLRMHNPDFYGDNLKNMRPIVDAVHAEKVLKTGFEIGRHGPFYRIVYPIFDHNTYIGALEFGIKAHEVLESLEGKTTHLASSFFSKEKWKKATQISADKQINIGSYVLINHNILPFNKFPQDFIFKKGKQHVTIDNTEYVLHLHPIFKDYTGKSIGGVVILQDISTLISEKNSFILRAILFTSVLLLISFFTLYFTFGKMISKLVRAEQLASKAKAEWERTFDAVPDMISILDKQHHIVRANKAMATTIGRDIKSIIHTKYHKTVHGIDEPLSHCPHVKLLQDRQIHTVETFDTRLQRYFSITVSPLTDENGDFFGSVHIARDITEQKEAEQKRKTVEEKLQKAEKMEAIGLMAGGVAHDLNNILSGVVSYPELLLLQLPKDDKLYKPIEAIQDSGKRAAAIVADLLTVARGVATVKEPASPNTLIEGYLGSPEFKKLHSLHPEVRIDSQLAEDIWNINCSPVHIQKVLMNLITNAVEAIPSQGIVSIATANQQIVPEHTKSSSLDSCEYVLLTIKDTGSGIAEQDLGHIFEPFYTKKRMGRSGTGLGLAVVWNTIKDHNAFIQVASNDEGTIFTLYFPPCHDTVSKQAPEPQLTNLNGNGTILVVDDEQQQRDIAAQMLNLLGYQVATVASGEEAVIYCQKTPVDLVLLDMLMEPGINGLQTYQQIIDFCPTQKAVIASGFSENSTVFDAKALGVGSFIKKPYSIEQLGKAVQCELKK